MWEYASVSRPSSDPDALVGALNERASDGWEVVSVVPGVGQLVAILKRDAGPGAAKDADVGDEAKAEAAEAAEPMPDAAAAAVAASPGGAVRAGEPSPWAPGGERAATPSAATEEPAGWAAAPDRDRERTSEPAGAGAGAAGIGAAAGPSAAERPAEAPSSTSSTQTQPTQAQPSQPASQPQTPANWYPDPSGRFELRYWNGTAWTEHVSRGGVQYTDPPTA